MSLIQPSLHFARYSLSRNHRVSITDTLRLTEAVRRILMGIEGAYNHRCLSPIFSGKQRKGDTLKGHQHAYLLPLDRDRDAYIDELLVYAPMGFNIPTLVAIDGIEREALFEGRVYLQLKSITAECPVDLQCSAQTWVSSTPFISLRHYRQNRDGTYVDWVLSEVKRFCQQVDMPAPTELKLTDAWVGPTERIPWTDFYCFRKSNRHVRVHGLQIVFPVSVDFPLAIGEYSHFGLGCFRPL